MQHSVYRALVEQSVALIHVIQYVGDVSSSYLEEYNGGQCTSFCQEYVYICDGEYAIAYLTHITAFSNIKQ